MPYPNCRFRLHPFLRRLSGLTVGTAGLLVLGATSGWLLGSGALPSMLPGGLAIVPAGGQAIAQASDPSPEPDTHTSVDPLNLMPAPSPAATHTGGVTMPTTPPAADPWPSVWRKAQVSQLQLPLENGRRRLTLFSLALAYSGPTPQAFTFSTGQRYDFLILDAQGRLRWRWSSSRMFTQMLGEERLAPGELRIYHTIWDGRDDQGRPLPAGDYYLQAIWTTNPPLLSELVPFSVAN